MLTHDPKLDDAALVLALRSDAGYIGAMGSRRAQERRRERLLAHGLAEAELARIAAPIGLDLGARDGRGDGALDHGRGRRRAPRPRRRPARRTRRRDPRGRRVSVAGLVLAAGEGRRFGGPKQLAPLRRPSAARARARGGRAPSWSASSSCSARARTEVRRGADLSGAEVVVCADWAEGIGASVRCGLAALAGADAVLVALADQPGITPAAVARGARRAGAGSRAPSTTGGPGHPVVLGAALLARAGELRGDAGFRDLLPAPRRWSAGTWGPAGHRHARGSGGGAAMKLEQSFEVAGAGGARCGRR